MAPADEDNGQTLVLQTSATSQESVAADPSEADPSSEPLSGNPDDPSLPGVKRRRSPRAPKQALETVKPPKMTKWEIAERRLKVQRLRLRGLSTSTIAKMLGVSFNTVAKDLEAVQKENISKITNFDQDAFVSENQAVLDMVIERAWGEYSSFKEGEPGRIKALDMVRVAQNDKLRALIETGMIHKEPQQVEHTHTFNLPWDEDTKHVVAEALLQRALAPQLAAPTPHLDHHPGKNVIEVEVVGPSETVTEDEED